MLIKGRFMTFSITAAGHLDANDKEINGVRTSWEADVCKDH